jgi:beta-lactam-binding protein with PASTA domain
VDLVVSLGPALVAVPAVVGQPQASAQAAILAAGLTVGAVTSANSATVPAGSVISQAPVGGDSVAAGTAVNLVVSDGK